MTARLRATKPATTTSDQRGYETQLRLIEEMEMPQEVGLNEWMKKPVMKAQRRETELAATWWGMRA